ncbi:MAG: hypothetical protein COB77_02350 [Gammaproteobacteria bacterium]|nr:MAG: hypothetical protein COB77_02350 [Gammaproteobacteria bacterium]
MNLNVKASLSTLVIMYSLIMLSKPPIFFRRTGWVLFVLLYLLSSNTSASTIVTTIKPLHSLVAHITDGIDNAVLLMRHNTSPHHYNMRPSERRLLADAQVIIWVGPSMESYLTKVIRQQKATTKIISALQASDLKLLDKRHAHSHESQPDATFKNHSDNIDPHLWLSTHNAAAISKHIARQLMILNPGKSEQYNKNLNGLLNKIEQTKKAIHLQLTDSNAPFIAYHDAFQYFVIENQLNQVASVSFSDEANVSLKKIRQIKTRIDTENIQCLVYQAPKPAIIKTLADKTSINAIELDPLGVYSKNDKNTWFDIMQNMTQNFNRCLSTQGNKPDNRNITSRID